MRFRSSGARRVAKRSVVFVCDVSCGASPSYRLSAMSVNVLRVADRVAGTAIERLTNDHHARWLGKLGRSAQRTPPDDACLWAAGDPPPRAGNAIEVLIEGAAYFPALG